MLIIKHVTGKRIDSYNVTPKNKTVHGVVGNRTFCGIDHAASETLSIPEDGDIKQVNCKRCLKHSDDGSKTYAL